jgi:hypothetical protein
MMATSHDSESWTDLDMGWFHKKRRLKLDPIPLAEMLHQILAEEDTPHSIPNAYNLPEAVHNSFRAKVLLYREALILFALVGQSHADPLYVPALREYERILFRDGPEDAVRSGRLQAVRDAMKDIADLLTPRDDPYLSWARRWFAEIGHDETNPITLGVFLCFWMDWYKAVLTGLNKMVA